MARYYEETALIEFVKQYTPHINGETTMECVERAIREAPTADVVPKSEVARLEQDVTRLVQENEDLKDSNEHLAVMLEETKIELEAMRGAANSYKMHYENLARETVYDFQSRIRHIFLTMCDGNDYNTLNLLQIDSAIEALCDTFIAELKKKYVEDKG